MSVLDPFFFFFLTWFVFTIGSFNTVDIIISTVSDMSCHTFQYISTSYTWLRHLVQVHQLGGDCVRPIVFLFHFSETWVVIHYSTYVIWWNLQVSHRSAYGYTMFIHHGAHNIITRWYEIEVTLEHIIMSNLRVKLNFHDHIWQLLVSRLNVPDVQVLEDVHYKFLNDVWSSHLHYK